MIEYQGIPDKDEITIYLLLRIMIMDPPLTKMIGLDGEMEKTKPNARV